MAWPEKSGLRIAEICLDLIGYYDGNVNRHNLYLHRHVSILVVDLGASIESLVHTRVQCQECSSRLRAYAKGKLRQTAKEARRKIRVTVYVRRTSGFMSSLERFLAVSCARGIYNAPRPSNA